jgi:hypothetical protein
MARYMIERNSVQVLGELWWPIGHPAACEYPLTAHDLDQLRDEQGQITRDDIDGWICRHVGDFSTIIDFTASIGDQEYPWSNEDNEILSHDILYPTSDEKENAMAKRALTIRMILAAVEADDNLGFCRACGAEAYGIEPDGRRYECEDCGAHQVYGAEELLLMFG